MLRSIWNTTTHITSDLSSFCFPPLFLLPPPHDQVWPRFTHRTAYNTPLSISTHCDATFFSDIPTELCLQCRWRPKYAQRRRARPIISPRYTNRPDPEESCTSQNSEERRKTRPRTPARNTNYRKSGRDFRSEDRCAGRMDRWPRYDEGRSFSWVGYCVRVRL